MAECAVTYLLSNLVNFLENEMQFIRDGKEELIAIRDELERISAFLRVADSLEERDEEVAVWVKQLREAAYDIEAALDEYKLLIHGKTKDSDGVLQTMSYYVGNMKAYIRDIWTRMSTYEGHWRWYKRSELEGGPSSSSLRGTQQDSQEEAVVLDENCFLNIEEPKKQLANWLLRGLPEQEVISVVGMAGLGKTTLVREVYNDSDVVRRFTIRAWITLSPSSKMEEILKELLQQISRQIRKVVPGSGSNTGWLKIMIKHILHNRRYLIVLDDVQHPDIWHAVRQALPIDQHGSRVMLITNNINLTSTPCDMDFVGKVYEMQPLPKESSWKLFCKKTFRGDSCPSHLEKICKDIVEKCDGLPLAILAISGVLATKDKHRLDQWDLVCHSLCYQNNTHDQLQNLKNILVFSFDDLPDHLKSCFLYFSVFPEVYEVKKTRLLRLWIAEGFVDPKEGYTLEEVAEDYLHQLFDRNLMQVEEMTLDGRIPMCCTHNLLREIITSLSRDQNFAAVADGQSQWPESVGRLSMHGNFKIIQENRSLSELYSLFMFGIDKESIKRVLLCGFTSLNVLDLEDAPLKCFPEQITDISSLRYLSFKSTNITEIPSSIGNLHNLETLDLRYTNVTEIPIEIIKLQRLCHLLLYRYQTVGYVHSKYGFKTDAEVGALQCLQSLSHIEAVNGLILAELGKLIQLRRLGILKLKEKDGKKLCTAIEKLINLRSLTISSVDEDEVIDIQHLSSPPPQLQRLYLSGRMQTLPNWISNLHGLTRLHLRWCRLNDDPIVLLENLPNLLHLELSCVYAWKKLCFQAKGFKKLKTLGLDLFDELNLIEVEKGAMPSLGILIIRRCKQLHNVPSGVEYLTKLKVLEFFDMSDELVRKLMEQKEHDDYQRVAHIPVLRCSYWTEKGWEVKFVERLYDMSNEFQVPVDFENGGFNGIFTKMSCCVKDLKVHYRIMSEIKSIGARIRNICERKNKLHHKFKKVKKIQSQSIAKIGWEDNRGNTLLLDEADLVGIEKPKKKVMELVVKGSRKREVVPVVGMGGLGKTTLVKQVYDDPLVKKNFQVRAWVTLSPSLRAEEPLKDIIRQIACGASHIQLFPRDIDSLNSYQLKITIKGLLQGKRYLIVLDDIWHIDRWDDFKYALPNNKLGSRVILTTRIDSLASAATSSEFFGTVYNLRPLSPESSWKLFCKKTFQGNSCPPHLEEICKYILEKCEGLPLYIVAVSGVLATKNNQQIDEWHLVQQSIRSEINSYGSFKNPKEVLSLSFNDLPYYLKSCFLHMTVFPEGSIIQRIKLIRLWIAEGFVETKEGKTMEEVANDYLNALLDRNLVQVVDRTSDGRVRACRIHNIFLGLISSKSRETNFAAVADERYPTWTSRVQRLSMHGKLHDLPDCWSLSQLRSLFMFGVDKESMYKALHHEVKLLRLLDMEAAPLKRFPSQVFDMLLLSYLSLRNSEVNFVPSSIGRLQNLETLDLKHTNVTKLPIEIAKLRRLRHLLVYRYETMSYTHFKYGFKTFAEIGALTSLQKLCYVEADGERSSIIIMQIGKLTQLRRLCILKLKAEDGKRLCLAISNLNSLLSLNVSSSDDEVIDLNHLSCPPPLLQRVYLSGRLDTLPHWMSRLHSLNQINLKRCRMKDDPVELLQNLPNLIHLELLQVYDWKVLRFKDGSFKKLKILALDQFDELRCIEVEKGAMPKLEKLTILRCRMLQDLPLGIQHLTKLKALKLFDMPNELVNKLKQDDQNEEHQKVSHVPELHYGHWTDAGWDVQSVERSGDDDSSSSPQTSMRSIEFPPCWK